jgi:EpsD family peptidyl-prolyl cis-trans isomerase
MLGEQMMTQSNVREGRSVRYMPRIAAVVALLPVVMGLVACSKEGEPSGQVVAKFGSQEITSVDLSTEFSALQISPAKQAENKRMIVDKLVDRRLLAEQAKKAELDKTPEFVAARHRSEEGLLAGIYVAKQAEEITVSAGEIAEYIKANPQKFDDRKIYIVQQLSTDATGLDPKSFDQFTSADQVVKALKAKGRTPEVHRAIFDSAKMSAEAATLLKQKGVGEGFSFVQGTKFRINFINQIQSSVPPEQQAASEAMVKADKLDQTIREEIGRLRAANPVVYNESMRAKREPKNKRLNDGDV